MTKLKIDQLLRAFWAEQDGVTAIEYALLAALIFTAIIAAVGVAGSNLAALFESLAAAFP